LTRTISTGS